MDLATQMGPYLTHALNDVKESCFSCNNTILAHQAETSANKPAEKNGKNNVYDKEDDHSAAGLDTEAVTGK